MAYIGEVSAISQILQTSYKTWRPNTKVQASSWLDNCDAHPVLVNYVRLCHISQSYQYGITGLQAI